MNGRWKQTIGMLFWVLLLLVLVRQPARASTWDSVTVDNSTNVTGKFCSMAVDPNGRLHIGYLDTNSVFPVLKYASNQEGSWVVESLQPYINDIYEASTSTVYTPAGPRIMAYSRNQATGQYKYQAVRKILGDGWQLQDIAGGKWPMDTGEPMHWDQMPITGIAAGTRTGSVQLDGFTYITFSDGQNLWYANEKEYFYYPFMGTGAVSQSDLGADGSGNIHIVSYNPTTTGSYGQGLLYAQNNTIPTLLVAGEARNPVIAIDKANTLHVAYIDGAFNIRYLSKPAGGAWSSPVTVAPVGSAIGGHISMKADRANGLHLAYYYNTNTGGKKGYLRYISRSTAGVWSASEDIPAISQSSDYGQYTALVVDDNNVVSIAYYDAKRSKLCVAIKSTGNIDVDPAPVYFGNVQLGAGSAVTKTVTVSNRGKGTLTLAAGNAVTLADNAAGEFAILNNGCSNNMVLAAGAACTLDVRLTAAASGTKSASLVIASNDPVTPSRSVALKGMSDYNLGSFTIDANAGIGGSISPAGSVSVAGGANQSFSITASPGFLVGSVVVDGVNVGTLTSYSFNEVTAGHSIHVSFTPVVPVALWKIEVVDNDTGGTITNTGQYCSLALDPSGRHYLGYLDLTNVLAPVLKYATDRTGAWVQEAVTAIPGVTTAGTATVFSEGVGPRIMAYTNDGSSRKYGAARKWTEQPMPGGSLNDWQLQWVAGDYFPSQYGGGPQPPIASVGSDTFTGAVQSDGYTFITFSDGNNLWYANEKDFYYLKLDAANAIAGAGKQSDLVLDPAKDIHIVYYTPGVSGTGELRYGYGHGGYFDPVNNPPVYSESVILTGVVSDPSITIDSQETLHVGYVKNDRVTYINKPKGGSWSTPYDLGPCGSNGAFTSIEANGLDIVHVAYYSNNGSGIGTVMYAQRMPDGAWSIPAPVWAAGEASGADVGTFAALVVDDNHNVSIAYHDATTTSLKLAKKLIPVIGVTPGSAAFAPGAATVFTVSNRGTGNQTYLSLGTPVLSGSNAAYFSITANGCSGVSLVPNDATIGTKTCTITVTADPYLTTGMTASLDIPSNDPYTHIKSVPLGGPAVTGNATTGGSFYETLQAAYNGAGDGGTIMAKAMTFSENLTFNLLKNVILGGGYNDDFSARSGVTTLNGTMEISFGTVEVQRLVIE